MDAVLRLGMFVLMSLSGGVLLMAVAARPLANALDLKMEFVTQVMGFCSVQGLALLWVSMFVGEHGLTWAGAFGFRRAPGRSAARAGVTMLVVLPLTVLVLAGISTLLLHVFGMDPKSQLTVTFIKEHPPAWQLAVMGFTAIVLAPVAEEALFRGVMYTTLKQRGYLRGAMFGNAALFAVIHFNLAALLPLFLLALVFTWLYERTGNLLAPIVAHMVFNAVNFAALVLDLPQWLEKMVNQ